MEKVNIMSLIITGLYGDTLFYIFNVCIIINARKTTPILYDNYFYERSIRIRIYTTELLLYLSY